MEVYNVLGLMSGTSLDGLDLALCRFERGEVWRFDILAAETAPYDASMRAMLREAFFGSAVDLLRSDHALGDWIGLRVEEFCARNRPVPDLLVSHGHTVFHQPAGGITYQIGNGWRIVARSGLPLVNDLRSLDVVLGGQGAPLVPMGDRHLFPEYDVCLNLGGFSNISFDDKTGQRLAYDVCPVNFVLNRLAGRLGEPYDDGGSLARSGSPPAELIDRLDRLSYYSAEPPKSLGQEWVDAEVMPLLEGPERVEDLMAAFTIHVAGQLDRAIRQTVIHRGTECTVLVTGGGAYNRFLMEMVSEKGAGTIRYVLPELRIIDYKEALIFAFLGLLKWMGEVNTLRSVTGARSDSSGGAIYRL